MICVTIGARRTGNHNAAMRRTHTKIIASPMPTRTRAPMPCANVDANANHACPSVIVSVPAASSFFEPNWSSIAPTGTCMTA